MVLPSLALQTQAIPSPAIYFLEDIYQTLKRAEPSIKLFIGDSHLSGTPSLHIWHPLYMGPRWVMLIEIVLLVFLGCPFIMLTRQTGLIDS